MNNGIDERGRLRSPRVTLRQWRMLLALRDCGSFSEAAEFLNLSQSTISHAISKLQEQIGLPLLRMEGRKAYITDVGLAMLQSSERLIRSALELESYAEQVRDGKDIEILIVVDHYFPPAFVRNAIHSFTASLPEIKFTVHDVSATEAKATMDDQKADVGICSEPPTGSDFALLTEIDYVSVAHCGSSLLKLGRPLTADDFEHQVEIVIGRSHEAFSGANEYRPRYWNVSSIDAAVAALGKGLGYAWLPLVQIQPLLAKGVLAQLPVMTTTRFKKPFYLQRGNRCGISPYIENFSAILRRAVSVPDGCESPSLSQPYSRTEQCQHSVRPSSSGPM